MKLRDVTLFAFSRVLCGSWHDLGFQPSDRTAPHSLALILIQASVLTSEAKWEPYAVAPLGWICAGAIDPWWRAACADAKA
jgi:hypothetical protein